jgi:hypothetical protein
MSNLIETHISISERQKRAIKKALMNDHSVKMRLSYANLTGKSQKIYLTQRQYNKISKAKRNGKGCDITLSINQLDKMKKAGFLAPLLIGLASALAPTLFGRLFPEKQDQGSGIFIPGTSNSGHGVQMANGEHIYNNIRADHGQGINLPHGNGGIYLPGNNAKRGRYKQKELQEPKEYMPGYGMKNKMGYGFVAPDSEAFQYLT